MKPSVKLNPMSLRAAAAQVVGGSGGGGAGTFVQSGLNEQISRLASTLHRP